MYVGAYMYTSMYVCRYMYKYVCAYERIYSHIYAYLYIHKDTLSRCDACQHTQLKLLIKSYLKERFSSNDYIAVYILLIDLCV